MSLYVIQYIYLYMDRNFIEGYKLEKKSEAKEEFPLRIISQSEAV